MAEKPKEKPARPVGRPSSERDRIGKQLRRWVIDGTFAAGSRLPAHRELARRLSANVFVVQLALQQLAEEGFVELKGRQGTFVASQPPHTRRFALAFPTERDAEAWVRFWTVLADEARRMREEGLVEFELYVSIARGLSESDDYRRLLDDVHKQRLAGIFFATPPFMVANTAILNQPGLPRVAITSPNSYKGVVALDLEGKDLFHQRAFELLRQRGHRRLAWFGVPGDPWEEIPARAKNLGLECKPHWVQTGIQTCPGPARNLAKLLAQLPKNDRPDCLVLTDDNLVEPAIRGLLESGLKIPEDIELVASCNFPAPSCDVPVNWLGYDIRNLLLTGVEAMRRWRDGAKPASSVRIPLEFEEEIRERSSSPRSH